MTRRSLTVGLGERAYDITIGPGLIDQAGSMLGEIAADRHTIVVSDDQVANLHLQRLCDGLLPAARKIDQFVVAPGEASKSMVVLAQLIDDILAIGVDRSVLLVAFGGGVIGDLTGFVAATLLRGVDFVQIPTSLLAQVDSSVGGKTGVNAKAGKNLIGAFYQPRAVIADTDLLATLPVRELRSGYAEVVKYGLLGDARFFDWLEQHGDQVLALEPDALQHAIHKSCRAKALIVEADERDDPNVVKAIVSLQTATSGHALYFTRATAPTGDGPLYHHIGIYAYQRAALVDFVSRPPSVLEQRERLEQLRALEAGMRIGVACVDAVPVGVDTSQDLELANRILTGHSGPKGS